MAISQEARDELESFIAIIARRDRGEYEITNAVTFECGHWLMDHAKDVLALIDKQSEGAPRMSLRSRITGDIAGIEGDLARTRLMLAEGEDLWTIMARLDDIKHRVEAIQQELVAISVYALKQVLDSEGERRTL